ncbi:MAG: hypothetical protein KF901_11355 [Myxococcales bacterium]|nr:hypothetical protein [Myxococcales bacterium]
MSDDHTDQTQPRDARDPRLARRRALRAARVVTLGLALAGCSASHEAPTDRSDAALLDADLDRADSDHGDAGALADAGVHCGEAFPGFGPDWEACCDAQGWDFEAGCIAWGPYVPPGAGMPPSRSGRA